MGHTGGSSEAGPDQEGCSWQSSGRGPQVGSGTAEHSSSVLADLAECSFLSHGVWGFFALCHHRTFSGTRRIEMNLAFLRTGQSLPHVNAATFSLIVGGLRFGDLLGTSGSRMCFEGRVALAKSLHKHFCQDWVWGETGDTYLQRLVQRQGTVVPGARLGKKHEG